MSAKPLGLVDAPDNLHRELFALEALPTLPTNTPVVIGVPWSASFDRPQLIDGAYWIGLTSDWQPSRGGHAVCLRPPALQDMSSWKTSYVQTGPHCVAFAFSRCMSLLNRNLYDPLPLFAAADAIDGVPGSNGTTLRAGAEILRSRGAWLKRSGATTGPYIGHGIIEYRWTSAVDEIARVLGLPSDQQYVEILNSWRGYPTVRLPLDSLARLLDGRDACVVTDRPGAVKR